MNIIPVRLPGEVSEGDDLAGIICGCARVQDGDIVVVAQKIVSKAQGRLVCLDDIKPSLLAGGIGAQYGRDPRLIELILREASYIVRMEGGIIITQMPGGHVCANSGIDQSNVPQNHALLLPPDPDAAAAKLRLDFYEHGHDVGIIISDTVGRPFRMGHCDIALGCAGIEPLLDYRGTADAGGRILETTVTAVADQIASGAELVMRKASGAPAAIVRGISYNGEGRGADIIRSGGDLFRYGVERLDVAP